MEGEKGKIFGSLRDWKNELLIKKQGRLPSRDKTSGKVLSFFRQGGFRRR